MSEKCGTNFLYNLQVLKIVSPVLCFGVLASLLCFLVFLAMAGYLRLKLNDLGIKCVS